MEGALGRRGERLRNLSPIALSQERKRKTKEFLHLRSLNFSRNKEKQRIVLEIPISQNQRKHLKLLDFKVIKDSKFLKTRKTQETRAKEILSLTLESLSLLP